MFHLIFYYPSDGKKAVGRNAPVGWLFRHSTGKKIN